MKNQKLFLDDWQDSDLELGLVRLAKELPPHEFFFHINKINDGRANFSRIKDLHIDGTFYNYSFARFEAYHSETKSCLQIISNKSTESFKQKEQSELFTSEDEINYLLPFHKEVDYILKTSDNIADFSLILLPEHLVFPIQYYTLNSTHELYDLILYYE